MADRRYQSNNARADYAREAAREEAARKRASRLEKAERKLRKQQEARRKAELMATQSVESSWSAHLSGSQKRAIVLLVILVGVVFTAIISFSALNASIQKNINTAIFQTTTVSEDIDNLKIDIEKNRNLSVIEQRATDELHMVYPNRAQYIYITEIEADTDNLKQIIKEKVYEAG